MAYKAFPRIVFFTGGTALRGLSRALAEKSPNAVHLVTTFDAGGSTAALRKAFAMPAVGDIRNRLLALADETYLPPSVLSFMQYRFPDQNQLDLKQSIAEAPASAAETLRAELLRLANGQHALWEGMPEDFASPLRELLQDCVSRLPPHFDPFGACVGNLVICGGYLRHKRDFGPILSLLGQLLHVRGRVVPIVEESLHLACILDDGSVVMGQQHFKCLSHTIGQVLLTVHDPNCASGGLHRADITSCRPPVSETARHYIATADLICYPMGSFYSSVLANLLPKGVGEAIAANPCPKVFIPNSGEDAELHGLSVEKQIMRLLETLRSDIPGASNSHLLNHVLIDSTRGRYHFDAAPQSFAQRLGISLRDCAMVTPDNASCHDPAATLEALLSTVAPSVS